MRSPISSSEDFQKALLRISIPKRAANSADNRLTEFEGIYLSYDGAGNLKWSAAGLPSGQACEANGTTPAVAAGWTA